MRFPNGSTRAIRALLAPALPLLLAPSITFQQHESPPRVARPGFVYDPARQIAVLFGGASDDGAYPGTWEWNGAEWRERTIVGPSPRANHGMAYDARRRVMVVFAGEAPDGHALGDTWEYDGASWRRAAERVRRRARASGSPTTRRAVGR
jgi:hypothetical protein